MKKYLESFLLLTVSLLFCFVDCNKGLVIPAVLSIAITVVNFMGPMDLRSFGSTLWIMLPYYLLPLSQVWLVWKPRRLRGRPWVNLFPPVLYVVMQSQDGIVCHNPQQLLIIFGPVAVYFLVFAAFRLPGKTA